MSKQATPDQLLAEDLNGLSDMMDMMFTPDGIRRFEDICTQRLQDDVDGKDTDEIVYFARNGFIGADIAVCLLAVKAKKAGQFDQLRQSVQDFARWRMPLIDANHGD